MYEWPLHPFAVDHVDEISEDVRFLGSLVGFLLDGDFVDGVEVAFECV